MGRRKSNKQVKAMLSGMYPFVGWVKGLSGVASIKADREEV